jgi:hypothetical protein
MKNSTGKVKRYTGESNEFTKFCELSNTEATHRQYRKFLMKRGRAYKRMMEQKRAERVESI